MKQIWVEAPLYIKKANFIVHIFPSTHTLLFWTVKRHSLKYQYIFTSYAVASLLLLRDLKRLQLSFSEWLLSFWMCQLQLSQESRNIHTFHEKERMCFLSLSSIIKLIIDKQKVEYDSLLQIYIHTRIYSMFAKRLFDFICLFAFISNSILLQGSVDYGQGTLGMLQSIVFPQGESSLFNLPYANLKLQEQLELRFACALVLWQIYLFFYSRNILCYLQQEWKKASEKPLYHQTNLLHRM